MAPWPIPLTIRSQDGVGSKRTANNVFANARRCDRQISGSRGVSLVGALGSKLRTLQSGLVAFYCPGCKKTHAIRIVDGPPCWSFNNNGDRPTFSPSIKVWGTLPITDDEHARIMAGEKVEPRPFVCHSFVREGQIQFLDDCTHALKGQTVELPDFQEDEF